MAIYKHVIVVGVDGMGNFNRIADTPNMDRIFKEGATTHDALSMFPTISAQNWGAMLLGTAPEVHGMSNESLNEGPHADDSPLPSVFRLLRQTFPHAILASYCDWEPINCGIIEQGYDVVFGHADRDTLAAQMAAYIKEKKPMLLFSQYDNVDHGGHCNGYGSAGHLEEVTNADRYIGTVYDAVVEAGIASDTLFLVIADHGGTPDGEHGGYTTGEKYIFFGAAGYDVPHGEIGPMQTCDLAAVILHALGAPVPAYREGGWISQVPIGIFSTPVPTYIVSEVQTEPRQTPATPDLHSEKGIVTMTPRRVHLKSAFFFDGNAEDSLEGVSPIETDGLIKYYSHGVNGSYAEVGRTGCLVLRDPGFDADFTIGLWVYACNSLNAVIYGTGNSAAVNDPGLTLRVEDHYYIFNLGNGCAHMSFRIPFCETRDGWTHLFFAVDRMRREIRFGRGFREIGILSYDSSFDIAFDTKNPFRVGNDTTGEKNRNQVFSIDDLLIFSDALNGCEFASIGRYYGI